MHGDVRKCKYVAENFTHDSILLKRTQNRDQIRLGRFIPKKK